MYILDTDHLSFWQRATAGGVLIRNRIAQIPPDDYGTTIISYAEQCSGWLALVNRLQPAQADVQAYTDLHDSLRFYSRIAVWDYTARAAAIFETFRKQKIKGGTNDLKIAAIALANEAVLLTSNRRDFERVPGLRIEDWSVTNE